MTLLQQYLEHPACFDADDPDQNEVMEFVLDALTPRDVITEDMLPHVPERYVFDCDAPGMTEALVRSGQVDNVAALQSVFMPANRVWLEWVDPNEDGRVGVLAVRRAVPEYPVTLFFLTGNPHDDNIAVFLAVSLHSFPVVVDADGTISPKKNVAYRHFDIVSFAIRKARYDEDLSAAAEFCGSWVRDWMSALFLVTTPRVCEIRETTFKASKQRRRVRAGKLPLVEYKKLVMRVGIGSPRYVSDEDAGETGERVAQRRRLHHVVGHFRTYTRKRDKPYVTFVPEHWRGDPELGVVIHERVVKP